MDALPLETWQGIFELACTDGGPTGNALSLTSKEFRAASRRARFHSLHLSADVASFQQFVALFERECDREDSDQPRVRHLSLFLCGGYRSLLLGLRPVPKRSTRHTAVPTTHEASNGSSQSPLLSTPEAVQKFIRLVAPDLWSLVIHVGPYGLGRDLQPHFLEYKFPLVREVAFLGVSNPARFLPRGAVASLVFPAATHLHIALGLNKSPLCLRSWSILAPRVTHLRVSNVGCKEQVEEIAERIDVQDIGTLNPAQPLPQSLPSLRSRTYPTVCRLLMEATHLPVLGRCSNPRVPYRAMQQRMRQIEEICLAPDVGVRAVLLPEPDSIPFREVHKQRLKEWAKRNSGGDGWWAGL
ncbi:hypothetical protein C2E23DRAFT_573936 [Lenzites betulinus]|nr:hypothetical protein C2E23DRAFT_573936 [Lenzites betulinus]